NNLKVKPPVIPKITRSMTQIRQQPPLKPASKRDGKGTALNSCQRAASVAVIKEKEFFQPHANIHPLKFDSLEIEQQLHQESVSKSDEKVTTRKRCQHAAPVADLKEKDSIQSRAEFPSSEYKLWEVIQQQTQESASKRKKGASRKKRQRVARIAALKGKKISRSQIVIPLSEDDNWEDEKIE
ncbi:791_t:CDS:1, partial [Funneliformis geosporum]